MAARVLTTLAVASACLAGCAGSPAAERSAGQVAAVTENDGTGAAPGRSDVVVPEVPIVDATAPMAVEVAAPLRLHVPDLSIDVPVDQVGVADDGQMEIPEDALRAGWYRYGAEPGMPGDAVIAAHAGSFVTPRGPFFDLRDAEPGMSVTVEMADGSRLAFVIASVEELVKQDLDLGPYFARDGDPRLVLITCGGQWDDAAQSYLSNIVVTARLDDG